MKYYKNLDGIRGIALLFVIAFHFGIPYIGFSWFTLPLFFTLSGFLITEILLSQKRNAAPVYFKNFYMRRALRIFPLYYTYIVIIVLLNNSFSLFDSTGVPYLFTYTYNFTRLFEVWPASRFYSHFWSLCVEEHFYLVWPLVVYYLSRKKLIAFSVCLLICAPIARFVLAAKLLSLGNVRSHFHIGDAVYHFSLSHLDAFAFGALIPLLDLPGKCKKPKQWLFFIFVFIISLGFSLCILERAPLSLKKITMMYPIASLKFGRHIWTYSLFGVFSMLIILVSIKDENLKTIWSKIFSNKFSVYWGKISYSAYIFHGALIHIFFTVFGRGGGAALPWPYFILYLVILAALASVSYYFFERYFLKLKARFNA